MSPFIIGLFNSLGIQLTLAELILPLGGYLATYEDISIMILNESLPKKARLLVVYDLLEQRRVDPNRTCYISRAASPSIVEE